MRPEELPRGRSIDMQFQLNVVASLWDISAEAAPEQRAWAECHGSVPQRPSWIRVSTCLLGMSLIFVVDSPLMLAGSRTTTSLVPLPLSSTRTR